MTACTTTPAHRQVRTSRVVDRLNTTHVLILTETLARMRIWTGLDHRNDASVQARLQHDGQFATDTRTLADVDVERAALAPKLTTTLSRYVTRLPTLRGIGPIGTWTLATEIFGWREIKNRRQLGGLVGLVPAPYQSGGSAHDQGITRAGNKHVRRLMVQLAWSWTAPAGQRLDPVVSGQVWPRQSPVPPHRGCRPGAQTAHCTLALCGTRGTPRRSDGEGPSGLSI
jgi:transposase